MIDHDRIRMRIAKRFDELSLSATGVWLKRYGIGQTSIRNFLTGPNTSITVETIRKLAAPLKVSEHWLLFGDQSQTDEAAVFSVPLVGWVQAGEMSDAESIHALAHDDIEHIITDHLGPGEWFATEVKGDSMNRVSPEGSRIFVNAADRDLVAGGYYLFSLHGKTTFKRYYSDPVVRFEPYSTNPEKRPIYPNGDRGWSVIGRVRRSVIDLR